uniref:Cna B-type domain-containing protein n=1 Tax=Streptococcus oralis TaxID=1303 RepID=UPI00189C04A7
KDNNWSGSFTDLDVNKAGKAIVYSVVEVTVPGYTSEVTGDAASGFTITNSYSPETVDVKATKNWDDANNQDGKRPTKITINLLADGQKVDSKEIQAAPDGTWTVEFTKLAKYKDGKEIKYTVTEEAVAEYESTITDFTITNKYAPKAIDYKVTKVWNDANNQDGKRPESVTVQLYKKVGDADPVAVEGKKLTLTAKDKTDANTWVASFTNLPQYEAGKEITYSIKEVDVPAGYEASVTGQVVTNTYTPKTVVLSGTKVWKDNNNQSGKRADKVKVQIFKGEGEKAELVQEIEVSEATGWKFESKALPKYENGTEIKYTVKEVAVKEYTSTVTTDKDGKYTVTNEYTPEKTSVKGKKIWKDEENKDGIRPASITVKLLADGQDTGKTAVASEATGWTYEFTELERYKDTKGTEFKYSVVEVPVDGYTSEVEGFNITNTHTPEKPTPGKPNEPGKPGQKPQLPNTGEKASNAAVVAGLALMSVTGGLYFVSRKNK